MIMKPHFESFSSNSSSASTWKRLSHMYMDLSVSAEEVWRMMARAHVLIGLNGSSANDSFFSLPSSFRTVPTKTQSPLSGTRLKSLSFCWVDVIADSTDSLHNHQRVTAPARMAREVRTC